MENQNKEKPLVSICCITYNHVKYIRDALEGFMMQKTDFPFEVLIHDDASTDGTADIIREYEQKYPDIIKPIYQTENQYSKGVKVSITYNFPRAQGKYIALCEGDDFWTDERKLQIQADYMESHPDVTICAHRRMVKNEIKKIFYVAETYEIQSLSSESLCEKLLQETVCFGTQTMMFQKKAYINYEDEIYEMSKDAPMGDMQLWVTLTIHGKCAFLPYPMAVYRVNSSSVSCFDDQDKLKEFCNKSLIVHKRIADFYNIDLCSETFMVSTNRFFGRRICSFIIHHLFVLRAKIKYYFWVFSHRRVKKRRIVN